MRIFLDILYDVMDLPCAGDIEFTDIVGKSDEVSVGGFEGKDRRTHVEVENSRKGEASLKANVRSAATAAAVNSRNNMMGWWSE